MVSLLLQYLHVHVVVFRFECVMNRPGLRSTFSEKYVAVFSNFEDVLEQVQSLYEAQKVYIWLG